jgi:hypothetical protein
MNNFVGKEHVQIKKVLKHNLNTFKVKWNLLMDF